ncbi:MAG: SDR family NAD(P)-dependent oxidoreductase [Ignavibacteriaceae bacterium]|nr:SDR family NAD(P)-dependent oxidoreductase [Ignavibacteriaceae bacterium]
MIFINGASRGIGKFLLQQYMNLGEIVLGTYNSTTPQTDLSNYIQIDVTDYVKVEKLVRDLQPRLENITLINCTGANYNSFAHKADIRKWGDLINLNLVSTFNIIRHFLALMREQNYGRIINLSSVVAQKGTPGTSAYAASKAALWGMAKSIAIENAQKNITINNLNLGYFDIGMIEDVPIEYREGIKNSIPVKSFGDPIQIFNSIEYLRNNSYINGTSVNINAGLY